MNRTIGVGHELAQGAADSNELWLDVQAWVGDRLIGRSGALGTQGEVDPWSYFLNAYLLDKNGNRINRRNAQDIFVALYNHQIPPGAAAVVHYGLAIPPDAREPVKVDTAVKYRKFDSGFFSHVMGERFVRNDLPIATLATDSIVLPLTGGDILAPPARDISDWERWKDRARSGEQPHQALYENDSRGRFEDVSGEAGLDLTTYGMGVAVGDYDGDGWVDIYLTSLNRNHLLRNEQGRFRDVTEAAGVGRGESEWSSSATFLDFDGDGDLDLFVVDYVKWSREIDLAIDSRLTGLGRAYGAPLNFVGTNNRLYPNEGDGRFMDVSTAAGIEVIDPNSGHPVGKGLGVVPVDYDRDGRLDLATVVHPSWTRPCWRDCGRLRASP